MASKSVLVFSMLVAAAAIAVPVAEAQLGGNSGSGGLLGGILGPLAPILGGILGPILGILRIQGTVYCTPTGNVGVNGTATPVFANAMVQLRCGVNVVSTATTNDSGLFLIHMESPLVKSVLSAVLNDVCRVAVPTAQASCNANLPSIGGLESKLQAIGSTASGLLDMAPSQFRFNANLN